VSTEESWACPIINSVAWYIIMSTLETIFEELRTLPPTKLEEAASYIHRLREATREERRAALERSAKILSDAEGAELARVIEDGCEKIDARDW
jgi:hypothetical protein